MLNPALTQPEPHVRRVLTPSTEIPLVGPGGEPVDFARTIVSHGFAELPPNRVDLVGRVLETTLPVRRGRANSADHAAR